MSVKIQNAHIFDGIKDCGMSEIIFEDGKIQANSQNIETIIDAQGKFLMPGLIDSHIHTYKYLEFLTKASGYGVTTLLEMGNREREITDLNKSHHEMAHVLSCYLPMAAPESSFSLRMRYPSETVLKDSEAGRKFVRQMIDWGADYIKIIMEEPGVNFPEEIGHAICDEAHKHNKKVIAHTTSIESFRQGLKFGLDVMTHMPMNAEMPNEIVSSVKEQGITLVPTIVMMENSANVIHKKNPNAPVSRDIAISNLRKFLKAGVPVIAGSDSTERDPDPPSEVEYGISLLRELQNQHEAGMNNFNCLISATSAPAKFFGQNDIGILEPGRRADILLIDGNPIEDIADIYKIDSVWLEGRKIK